MLLRSSSRFRARLYGIQPTSKGHYQVIQDTLDNAFRWAQGEQEAAAVVLRKTSMSRCAVYC